MRKFILLLLLAYIAPLCSAQYAIGSSASTPNTSPSYLMPSQSTYINTLKIPGSRSGYSSDRLTIVCVLGVSCLNGDNTICTALPCLPNAQGVVNGISPASGGNVGQFRINCNVSHFSFDDPIVWPGAAGKTHLHVFFGNVNTASNVSINAMSTTGNSTCAGGTINRNGYWVPAMVYHCSSTAVGCTRSRDGEVQIPSSANFYYKGIANASTTTAKAQVQAMVWPAAQHRMIAGDVNSTSELNSSIGKFSCLTGTGSPFLSHLPNVADLAAAGNCSEVIQLLYFPQCWNNATLDSPDHKSHMAYGDFNEGCTDPNYPKMFPWISYNIHYSGISNADWPYMRLSSDKACADEGGPAGPADCGGKANNGTPAGASFHGDWLNGWRSTTTTLFGNRSVTDVILDQCLRRPTAVAGSGPIGLDCHDGVLSSADPTNPNNMYYLQQ